MKSTTMRLVVCAGVMLYIGTACKKIELPSVTPQPVEIRSELIYPDQGLLKPWSPAVRFDLDKDGRFDILFYTQLVGDPIHREDKMQFRIGTNLHTALAVNAQEETPRWGYGDAIPDSGSFGTYTWYAATDLLLMQEVTPMLPRTVFWTGSWQHRDIGYIGFTWLGPTGKRLGWISLRAEPEQKQMRIIQAGWFPVGESRAKTGF